MNKSFGIVFLAALLICGNASIIEHIYNSTHLKGDVNFDLKDGVKVGYNGNLKFDNGIVGFDIANIGGNFKAAVNPSERHGNSTNATVDYSGDIQVAHGCHTANVTVNGTAGFQAEVDASEMSNDGKMAYKSMLTNKNQWNVAGGSGTANGTSNSFLEVSAKARKHGDMIMVSKRLRGGAAHRGTATDKESGESVDFKIVHSGKAKIKAGVFVQTPHDGENETGHLGGVFPTIAYTGIAKMKRGSYVEVNEDSAISVGQGAGEFGGLIWYDKKDDNDTFIRSMKHARSADYMHKGVVILDDELHEIYGGVGTVGAISAAEFKLTKDGKNLTAGSFETGNDHHLGISMTNPGADDEVEMAKQIEELHSNPASSFGKYEPQNTDSLNHKSNRVKTYTHTTWGAGNGMRAYRNDNNTVDVAAHGGHMWEVDGWASNSKKPIHEHGSGAYNATFEVDKKTSTVRNILLKYGNNPQAIEEIRQRVKVINMLA